MVTVTLAESEWLRDMIEIPPINLRICKDDKCKKEFLQRQYNQVFCPGGECGRRYRRRRREEQQRELYRMKKMGSQQYIALVAL